MTSFTRTWNSSYEAIPNDAESAKKGASRIREVKNDIRERMVVDHRWAGDQYDGQHLQVTMQALTADPSPPGGADTGMLYCKVQAGIVELYFKDSAGNVVPLTSAVSGFVSVLPGTILPFGNSQASMKAVATKGDAYVYCNGQVISRTDFPALFFAIGTVWGIGDGVSTFTVPDLRGRTLIGTGTGSGLTTRNAGDKGGEETHGLLIGEIPGHQHNIDVNSSTNTPGNATAIAQTTGPANGLQLTESAGGQAIGGAVVPHNNMQPFAAINWVIKT